MPVAIFTTVHNHAWLCSAKVRQHKICSSNILRNSTLSKRRNFGDCDLCSEIFNFSPDFPGKGKPRQSNSYITHLKSESFRLVKYMDVFMSQPKMHGEFWPFMVSRDQINGNPAISYSNEGFINFINDRQWNFASKKHIPTMYDSAYFICFRDIQ